MRIKKSINLPAGHTHQNNHWNCGPAALNIALGRQGWRTHFIDDLARVLNTTPEYGTKNRRMVAYVRRLLVDYEVVSPTSLHDLRRWLAGGYSVIVLYYDVYDRCGHFSVITNISKGRVALDDPWFGKGHSYSLNYFYKIWRDSENNRRWSLAFRRQSRRKY
ncbi:MAG: cysteine peptidase family C39 domain-containing protein [bacterium]|nr:cysteine peptidase family C39 domain-containing protein [bacterium]